MDTAIKDYSDAVKNYIELSQKEIKIRILVKNAKARLQKAKEELRAVEQDLLEPNY